MRRALAVATLLLLPGWVCAQAQAVEGAALAAACSGCHGERGALPALSTLPVGQLRDALLGYRAGTRTGTVMNRIAKGYSPDELAALASALGQAAAGKAMPGKIRSGKSGPEA